MMEAEGRSMLRMVKNLIEGGCRARYAHVVRKELRRIIYGKVERWHSSIEA